MPKYYYTDPLKAAWMHRNFGVELEVFPTEEQAIEYGTKYPWNWMHSTSNAGCLDEMVEDALKFLDGATGKVYVHPDSEHVIKLNIGDYVSRNDYSCIQKVCADSPHDTKLKESQDIFHLLQFRIAEYEIKIGSAEIIRRNGKHFFMPEVEII